MFALKDSMIYDFFASASTRHFLPDLREIRSNSEGVQFAFHSQRVSCSLDSTLYIIANIPQLPVIHNIALLTHTHSAMQW